MQQAARLLLVILGSARAARAPAVDDFDWRKFADVQVEQAEQVEQMADDVSLNFLSATLGDQMVLQRAPKQAIVFGHTLPHANVTTTFNGNSYTATADAGGTWRQALPAMEASTTPFNLTFTGSAGEKASLRDVVFGDVFVCGGQSNMQFAMGAVANATEEIAKADEYPHVRLFTVGQGTKSAIALGDLQTVGQRWAVASAKSISGNGGFGYFSAVCWFFGRHVSEGLGNKVPIGLVSNNWGGTPVEMWSTSETFKACNRSAANGSLFNAMIAPYTVGPMALRGFTWYQGEANTHDLASAQAYGCMITEMINTWRKVFAAPDAYFGFVQLCAPHSSIRCLTARK